MGRFHGVRLCLARRVVAPGFVQCRHQVPASTGPRSVSESSAFGFTAFDFRSPLQPSKLLATCKYTADPCSGCTSPKIPAVWMRSTQTVENSSGDKWTLLRMNINRLLHGRVFELYCWTELTAKPSKVRAVNFKADGSQLCTASEDGTAKVFDLSTGKVLKEVDHNSTIWWADFSQDGELFCTCSDDRSVRVYDCERWELQEMFGHGLPVKSASFSSGTLATASGDAWLGVP